MVAVSLKKKLKGDSSRTHEVGQSHPYRLACISLLLHLFFFFKQKTAYEIGLGIPAEPLFRSDIVLVAGCPCDFLGAFRIACDLAVLGGDLGQQYQIGRASCRERV